MQINIERLEQAGYRVQVNDHVINIEADRGSENLARILMEQVELPPREKEQVIDEFITKVNNAKIMLIINEEY